MNELQQLIADQSADPTPDGEPGTTGFTSVDHDPDDDLGHRGRGSVALLGAVTVDGYAFTIQQFGNPDIPVVCRYWATCGRLVVLPHEEWPCELRPDMEVCRCNGCTMRREGVRKRGGQPVTCGSPECERRLKTDRQRRWRAAA